MSELISLENISVRPITEEILDLNIISKQYGLILSEEEAKELSDTRNRSLVENERIEIGVGPVTEIVKRFCSSRYLNNDNYTYALNEIVYLFYYIKTETDDKISDSALIGELFERFELYARGSIDVLQSREAERIIRKVNSGENYTKWYADRDELDFTSREGLRETPQDVLCDGYGEGYFDGTDGSDADHTKYENDMDYFDDNDIETSLDAYDEFLEIRELLRQEDTKSGVAEENPDEDEEN